MKQLLTITKPVLGLVLSLFISMQMVAGNTETYDFVSILKDQFSLPTLTATTINNVGNSVVIRVFNGSSSGYGSDNYSAVASIAYNGKEVPLYERLALQAQSNSWAFRRDGGSNYRLQNTTTNRSFNLNYLYAGDKFAITATTSSGSTVNFFAGRSGSSDTGVTVSDGSSNISYQTFNGSATLNGTELTSGKEYTVTAVSSAVGNITFRTNGTVYITKIVITRPYSFNFKKASYNDVYTGFTKDMSEEILRDEAIKSNTITYTSNNPEVASIDASTGVLTAHKAGTVTITATDSQHYYAMCTVTIANPTVAFSSATYTTNAGGMSTTALEMKPTGLTSMEGVSVVYSVESQTPGTAAGYTIDAGASVMDADKFTTTHPGDLYGVNPGTATVKVTVTMPDGKTTASNTATFDVSAPNFAFAANSYKVNTGGTLALAEKLDKISVFDGKTITYSITGDGSVATINPSTGTVTGVGDGEPLTATASVKLNETTYNATTEINVSDGLPYKTYDFTEVYKLNGNSNLAMENGSSYYNTAYGTVANQALKTLPDLSLNGGSASYQLDGRFAVQTPGTSNSANRFQTFISTGLQNTNGGRLFDVTQLNKGDRVTFEFSSGSQTFNVGSGGEKTPGAIKYYNNGTLTTVANNAAITNGTTYYMASTTGDMVVNWQNSGVIKSVKIERPAIDLTADKTELVTGQTATLTLKQNVFEGENVVYTMDKEGVVTLSGSTITATGNGTVTITATNTSGIKGSVTITVTDPTFDITPKVFTMKKGTTNDLNGNKVNLHDLFTMTPEGYFTNYDYDTKNSSIATVNASGIVTAVAEGTTQITVKPKHGITEYPALTVTVDITVVDRSAIDDYCAFDNDTRTWNFYTITDEHFNGNSWWRKNDSPADYTNKDDLASNEDHTPKNIDGNDLLGLRIRTTIDNQFQSSNNMFRFYPGIGIAYGGGDGRNLFKITTISGRYYTFFYATRDNTASSNVGINNTTTGSASSSPANPVGATLVDGQSYTTLSTAFSTSATAKNPDWKSVTLKATANEISFGSNHNDTRFVKIVEKIFQFSESSYTINQGATLNLTEQLTTQNLEGDVVFAVKEGSTGGGIIADGVFTAKQGGAMTLTATADGITIEVPVTVNGIDAPAIAAATSYTDTKEVTITSATGTTLKYAVTYTEDVPAADDEAWQTVDNNNTTYTADNEGTFWVHAVSVKGEFESAVVTTGPFTWTPTIDKPTLTVDKTNYSDNTAMDYYGKEVTVTINTPSGADGILRKWGSSAASAESITESGNTGTTATYSDLDDVRVLTAYAYRLVNGNYYLSDPITLTLNLQKETAFSYDFQEEGDQAAAWSTYAGSNGRRRETAGAAYDGVVGDNVYGEFYTQSGDGGSRSSAYTFNDNDIPWGSARIYTVEFDFKAHVSTLKDANEFTLLGGEASLDNKNYSGDDRIFGIVRNSSGENRTWYFGGANNKESATLADNKWYHVKATVKQDKTITFAVYEKTASGDNEIASGSDVITGEWKLKTLYILPTRYNREDNYGTFCIDNLKITLPISPAADPVISTAENKTAYVEDEEFSVNVTTERGKVRYKRTVTADKPAFSLDDDTWTNADAATTDVDSKNYGTFYMHAVSVSDDGEDISHVVTAGPYTFTPSIAAPIIKIGDEEKTGETVNKTFDIAESGFDVNIIRSDETKKDQNVIWYRWGEKTYTKEEMARANTINTTVIGDMVAKYVGFETSEKLTAVAARQYGNGEYYWSDPVTLTITSAEPASDERLILMDQDYNKDDNPAVWTTSSAKFTRNVNAGEFPEYYGEYINNDDNGQRMLGLELYAAHSGDKRIYWVEFDAQFDLSKAAETHTPELTLVGEPIAESNTLYSGNAALFRMASSGSTNEWNINQTGNIMPLENAQWYSYKFIIDENTGTVGYRIINRESKKVVVQGEYYTTMSNENFRLAQNLRVFLPNGGCKFLFDNLKVWTTKTDDTEAFLKFTATTATADLTAMNFEEPKLFYAFPSGNTAAVIRYTTNNPNVGRVDYNTDEEGTHNPNWFKVQKKDENGKVVKDEDDNPVWEAVRYNSTGDLLLKNTGTIVVTATMYESADPNAKPVTVGGKTITASYTVTVKANTAAYEVTQDGDKFTYKFTGDGQLTERQNVSVVPGIKVDFGPQQNANTTQADGESDEDYIRRMSNLNGTIVKYTKYTTTDDKGAETDVEAYYATTLAQDGWRDVVVKDTTIAGESRIIPTEGTFYKFTPQTSGKFTFSGLRDGGSTNGKNSVVMISYKVESNGTYSDYQLHNDITINADHIQSKEIEMKAGRVYFLYGNNPNTEDKTGGYKSVPPSSESSSAEEAAYQWTTFQLTSYSYEVKFKFETPAFTLTAGETSKSQQPQGIEDGETITYTLEKIGDVNAEFDSDGYTVKNISGGGAVIVTATNEEGYSVHYAINSPYEYHKWNFDDISEQKAGATNDAEGYLKQYNAQWTAKYKNAGRSDYINNAVLSNRYDINGDNALYIPLSAGLVITAKAQRFGTTVNVPIISQYGSYPEIAQMLQDGVTGDVTANYDEIKDYKWISDANNNTLGVSALTAIQFVNWRGDLLDASKNMSLMGDPTDDIKEKWGVDKNSGEYEKMVQSAISAMKAYNLDNTTLTSPDLLAIQNGASNTKITIPRVKADQYIRVHMNRYTNDNGSKFDFENLTAIDGSALTNFKITGIITSENGYNEYKDARGAYVFKVAADGDASFAVNDGWVDIYDIELFEGTSYVSEMQTVADYSAYSSKYYGLADNTTPQSNGKYQYDSENNKTETGTYTVARSDFSKVNVSEANPIEIPLVFGPAAALFSRATTERVKFEATNGVTFKLKDNSGKEMTLTDGCYTTTSGAVLRCTLVVTACPRSGGNIKMVQEALDANGNIVVDRAEHWFSVASLVPQSYPITWDFTKRNMSKTAAGSAYATKTYTADAAGTNDAAKTYGAWNGDQLQVAYPVEDVNGATIYKPAFASGGELSSGGQVFAEAEGLGVGINAFDKDNLNGVTLNYDEEGGDSNGSLHFESAGSLSIPSVCQNGKETYIYIQSDKSSDISATISDGGTIENIATDSDFAPNDDVTAFKVTTAGDVTVQIPAGTHVNRVGITDITKPINQFGYATESRNIAIDHYLTGEFIKNDVNAYIIKETGYNQNESKVSFTPAEVIGSNEGTVLYLDNATKSVNAPLFKPAINVPNDDCTDNLLKGNVEENKNFKGTTDDGKVNFILTNIARYRGNVSEVVTNSESAEDIGFYRSLDGTMRANTSYLQLTIDQINTMAKGIVFITLWGEFFTEEPIATRLTATDDVDNDEANAVYYNLNGQKLEQRPSLRGIYIRNGKKVHIK